MILLNIKLISIQTILLLGQSCTEIKTSNNDNKNSFEKIEAETTKPNETLNSNFPGDTTIKSKNNKKMTNPFPFKISNNGGQFTITAETESPELYPKYAEFFEKFGYSGNGYCWEGHISQILEKLNPELLKHIDFDPEAGAFFAHSDTEENQKKFIEVLSPIFSDLKKLEEYVKKADHSRIVD